MNNIQPLINTITAEGENQALLNKVKAKFMTLDSTNMVNDAFAKTYGTLELSQGMSNSQFKGSEEMMKQLQKEFENYEKPWDYTDLSTAMEFVRNDENQVVYEGQSKLRVFPSSGFLLPVNADNAVKNAEEDRTASNPSTKLLLAWFNFNTWPCNLIFPCYSESCKFASGCSSSTEACNCCCRQTMPAPTSNTTANGTSP